MADARGRHGVAILVLGMHRSGTSALTWLLGRLGATLPGDAVPSSGENSKGYFESQALVKADDLYVRAARSSWFDPRALDASRMPPALRREREAGIAGAIEEAFGAATLLAIKDPRQCRFVPVVERLLADAGVRARAVLMLRPAAEVAASLHARDRTTADYGHLLWLRHMLDAERDSRTMPRAIVSFDDLLADWRRVATTVAPLLGAEGWSPDEAEVREIDAFFEPSLRHHRDSDAVLTPELATLVADAEAAFAALARDDAASPRAALDTVAERLAAMPWLEADIVHDELRHRRAPAPDVVPAKAEGAPAVAKPIPPEPVNAPDPDRDAALIRGSGLFDAGWYRDRYPDAAESALDPVDHYLEIGAARGYNPNPLFDTGYYARQMARRGAGRAGP